MNPLPDPIGIYAILDTGTVDSEGLPDAAAEMAEAGVRVFQVRAKTLPTGRFESLVGSLRSRLPGEAVLIVNDRVDVALATGADGVHVGEHDIPFGSVRRLMPAPGLVGLSTHGLEEVEVSSRLDCDYVGFGPVFESPTKVTGRRIHQIEGLRQACMVSSRPVVAIGGIAPGGVGAVRGAGASGVALISGLLVPGRVAELSRRAVREFNGT